MISKIWSLEWIKRTYDEIIETFGIKKIGATNNWYALPPGIQEVGDLNWMCESSLPNEVLVRDTIDEIRLKLDLTTERKRWKLLIKLLVLGFSYFHSRPLGKTPKVFYQNIPGTYKSGNPPDNTRNDKSYLKSDFICASTINDVPWNYCFR